VGDDANNHPKPFMYWPDDHTNVQNFNSNKYDILKNVFHVDQPKQFTLGNFLGMIKYFSNNYPQFECLHVYIAAFLPTGNPRVPQGCGNQMTLIFAPATNGDENGPNDLDYFILPPHLSFSETNINDFKIDFTTFQDWTNYFQTKFLGKLLPTLNNNDADNRDPKTNKYSDTKYITYCKSSLIELVCEQTYIHKSLADPSSEIKLGNDMIARLAAFGANGNPRRPGTGKGRKRLFVQFDFLDEANKQIVYLDDMDGFEKRPDPQGQCGDCIPAKQIKDKKVLAVDNGQLCPTVCN